MTATIAAIRAAPSDFRELDQSLHGPRPGSVLPGKNCPVHGYRRVNEWPVRQRIGSQCEAGLLDHFDDLLVLGVDDDDLALGHVEAVRLHLRHLLADQRRDRVQRDLAGHVVARRTFESSSAGDRPSGPCTSSRITWRCSSVRLTVRVAGRDAWIAGVWAVAGAMPSIAGAATATPRTPYERVNGSSHGLAPGELCVPGESIDRRRKKVPSPMPRNATTPA